MEIRDQSIMDSTRCFSLNSFRRNCSRRLINYGKGPSPGIPEAICRRFSLTVIETATKGFHPDKAIGDGGSGTVYKGCLDGDGTTQVAILRWNRETSYLGRSDFWKEAEICSQLRHPNLVAFRGFCSDNDEMISVHEYMPNGSLDNHLFGEARETLIWRRRILICIDVARGLHYLHSGVKHTIIHRHVTAHNILLGRNWEAKLSGLGITKVSKGLTRVSSRVMGTFGYAEPEYMATGELTEKTDVYSFGVVLFEVLSGRRVLDRGLEQPNLIEWVVECKRNGTMGQIVEPCVKGQIAPECLRRFVEIAERCVFKDRVERPGMGEVQVGLEDALQLQEATNH